MKTKRVRLALGFAIGFILTYLILKGAKVIHERNVAAQVHTATFSAQRDLNLLAPSSGHTLAGRVLARDAMFAVSDDLVASRNWILVLRMDNHLTGVNLVDGSVRDFSAFLTRKQGLLAYSFMWRGQRGEVFVGSTDQALAQLSIGADGSPIGIHQLSRTNNMAYSIPVSGKTWISNGYYQDSPATLLVGRLEDDHLVTLQKINKMVFSGLPPAVHWEVNRNSIVARSDGGLLAQAFWYAPYIYIYDATGAFLRSTPAPVSVNQVFGEHVALGAVRMNHLPNTTRCYIAVTASQKDIVGLFSGKTIRDLGSNIEGDELHIFDWEGRLAGIDKLDSSVSRIEASPDGNVLYAIRRGSDPAILEYRLAEASH